MPIGNSQLLFQAANIIASLLAGVIGAVNAVDRANIHTACIANSHTRFGDYVGHPLLLTGLGGSSGERETMLRMVSENASLPA